MDYIECTHCGKQFAITEKVKAAEGKLVPCAACKEKFKIVINSEETSAKGLKRKPMVSDEGWDPSKTMPIPNEKDGGASQPSDEQSIDDDDDEEASEVLAQLQAARKKKMMTYAGLGLVVLLLLATSMMVTEEEVVQSIAVVKKAAPKKVEIKDENNPACKQEAAKQWLIDYQAMHGDYSADEFVRILKRSQLQTKSVNEKCKRSTIIKEIITAATAKEKPEWFEAEIDVLQANRKR